MSFLFLSCLALFTASFPHDIFVCGVPLNAPNTAYSLRQSIGAYGSTCLAISAPNVTLDCRGYAMNSLGETSGEFSGIMVTGGNAKVRNCQISNFTHGILIINASHGHYEDINVSAKSFATYGAGAIAVFSNGTAPQHNVFNRMNITAIASDWGVDMEIASPVPDRSQFPRMGGSAPLDGFNVFANSTITCTELCFFGVGNHNVLQNMTIIGTGTNAAAVDFVAGHGNVVANSTLIVSGDDDGENGPAPIWLETNCTHNLFLGNLLISPSSGSSGVLFFQSSNNTFIHNIIICPGCSGDLARSYAFWLDAASENNTFLANSIYAGGWVNDSSAAGNFFNNSTTGNNWNHAKPLGAWAEESMAVPSGSTNASARWVGNSHDWRPITASSCT